MPIDEDIDKFQNILIKLLKTSGFIGGELAKYSLIVLGGNLFTLFDGKILVENF